MRKLKKMLAMLSAAAVLCGSAVSMQASATNDLDVNDDGSVDILDVMMVNRYLLGSFSLSDPSVMDVNNNYMIDSVDSAIILASTINQTVAWSYN